MKVKRNPNGSDRLFRGTLPVIEKANGANAVNIHAVLTNTHTGGA